MGKRELLLIIGFLVAGVVVYHATAPPSAPDDQGLSFSRLLDGLRRHVAGNRASVDLTTTSTLTIDPDVEEIRVVGYLIDSEITGEDRHDVESTVVVHSAAYNDEEARRYGAETVLTTDRAGSSLILRMKYPKEGRQRADINLRVPSRLRVRIEAGPNTLVITNVAGVDLIGTHDEASITKIAGRVSIDHRGGPVIVKDVAWLKFHGRGTELTAAEIHGDASFLLEGGELSASGVAGALDVEARNAEVKLSKLDATKGPTRISVTGDRATLTGVASDTRIDGRNSELDITMSASAPMAVYNTGDDAALTLPAGGYKLDAVAVEGKIGPETLIRQLGLEAPDGPPDANEMRVSGEVQGGGPAITLRLTRGDLTLRR